MTRLLMSSVFGQVKGAVKAAFAVAAPVQQGTIVDPAARQGTEEQFVRPGQAALSGSWRPGRALKPIRAPASWASRARALAPEDLQRRSDRLRLPPACQGGVAPPRDDESIGRESGAQDRSASFFFG
jgi:hypothetical protein